MYAHSKCFRKEFFFFQFGECGFNSVTACLIHVLEADIKITQRMIMWKWIVKFLQNKGASSVFVWIECMGGKAPAVNEIQSRTLPVGQTIVDSSPFSARENLWRTRTLPTFYRSKRTQQRVQQ